MGFSDLPRLALTVEGMDGEGLDDVPGERWYAGCFWSSLGCCIQAFCLKN